MNDYKSISNAELTLDQIPINSNTWEEIELFALTFDGYSYWGDETCADIANRQDASTLTKARTCLFFEQRRWRHFDEIPTGADLKYIKGLIKIIHTCVLKNRKDLKMLDDLKPQELKQLAEKYQCLVKTDNKYKYQRAFRIMQSIWRESKGYTKGPWSWKNKNKLLGSKLPEEFAKKNGSNFLTENIIEIVNSEVDSAKKYGKLYGKPRIYNDLLSSQPLCFNLFGELKKDLALASKVFKDLSCGFVEEVEKIEFEYSPGRSDPKFTDDRSAFDVYVQFKTKDNKDGFYGIEVKYHEDLKGKPSSHKSRYDKIVRESNCFKDDYKKLKKQPLQQIWRDHLLALAMINYKTNEFSFDHGTFVLLYPKDNWLCSKVAGYYRAMLTDSTSFQDWTIETVVNSIKQFTSDSWIEEFYDRYLDLEKLRNA